VVFIGVVAVLLALIGARMSLQFPWMRGGWRFGFILNGPAVVGISLIMGALICVAILTYVRTMPNVAPSGKELSAFIQTVDENVQTATGYMQVGLFATGLWGLSRKLVWDATATSISSSAYEAARLPVFRDFHFVPKVSGLHSNLETPETGPSVPASGSPLRSGYRSNC